jgi:pimeloyl-ACP methyl ester carboxylesterase
VTSVVLVHGSFLGPWVWTRVASRLTARGLRAVTVSLPSCALQAGPHLALGDDVAAVVCAIREQPDRVVLCGHSYGGIVITAAGSVDRVSHLVYLCAYMPDSDESLLDLAHGGSLPWAQRQSDGRTVPDPACAARALLGASSAETVGMVASRLRPQRTAVFAQRPGNAAWRSRPSTFVVATRDAVLPPGRQRQMASRADRRIVLQSGHLPQLTSPGRVADIVAGVA